MKRKAGFKKPVRQSMFSLSLFVIFWGVLLLMSGIHQGLVVMAEGHNWFSIVQTISPMVYWAIVAVLLTLYTHWRIRQTYEKPMQELAEATDKVAHGDFSVYVQPRHAMDKLDYLDVMIMDFNMMVEELGSIETLKTDFFSNVSHEVKKPQAVNHSNAEVILPLPKPPMRNG